MFRIFRRKFQILTEIYDLFVIARNLAVPFTTLPFNQPVISEPTIAEPTRAEPTRAEPTIVDLTILEPTVVRSLVQSTYDMFCWSPFLVTSYLIMSPKYMMKSGHYFWVHYGHNFYKNIVTACRIAPKVAIKCYRRFNRGLFCKLRTKNFKNNFKLIIFFN